MNIMKVAFLKCACLTFLEAVNVLGTLVRSVLNFPPFL
jgi:hypothetical protein